MASVAHRIKIQILFSGNLGPVFAGLADGSFAVLPCSLSRLRSSCQALLRPLCHGFAVTAGGSLAALPQILGFPGSLKSYPASFASQPLPPPLLQESVVVAGLFASEAGEQGCTVFESGSRSCSAVWVTVGQGSAFSATGWSSSHRALP